MSLRAVKRLERKRLQDNQTPVEEVEEVEDVEEEYTKPKFNAFDLLNDGDDSEEEPSIEVSESEEQEALPIIVLEEKSTKKKKAKQKKPKLKEESDDEFDRILEEAKKKDLKTSKAIPKVEVEEEDDDYDFEEEYDLQPTPLNDYDSNFKFFTSKRLAKSLPLLSIGTLKNLDPDQEFRNLFGNLSLEAIEDANSTSSLAISPEVLQQFKRMARLTRGWSGKDRRSVPGSTRKLLLSKIRDDWLPTTIKPLSMEEISKTDVVRYYDYNEDDVSLEELELKVKKELRLGVKYFRFSKSSLPQDRMADTRFYASVVLTPDPDSLIRLLQQAPYHAETLLQVAMVILRQGNEKSTSNSLIEKALFVFDRSFHKNLHEMLYEGKSELIRLPYESFSNRQFYLCLFRYITGLGERRLFSTALSYCKLLLGLSPAEDPMGVRYFIDFYAIMSEEFKYLTDLASSPLFTTYKEWLTPGMAFSSVLAYLHLNDEANARAALQVAFERHPYTAMKLLEAIGLATTDVISNPSTEDQVKSETYLVRAALLWNDQPKRQFLHDELSKMFSESTKPTGIKSSIFNILGYGETKSKDVPINLIRFAIVSGENKIMARLPEQVWALNNTFEYDVLPPRDTKVAYNEFTGVLADQDTIADSLINYIDHNLLGNLVTETGRNNLDFDDEE